jgi:hypothetical protein
MNRIKLVAILAVLGIAGFVAMSSIYTVSEVEQAIITQFGKPIGAPVTADSHGPCSPTSPSSPKTRPSSFPRAVTSSNF